MSLSAETCLHTTKEVLYVVYVVVVDVRCKQHLQTATSHFLREHLALGKMRVLTRLMLPVLYLFTVVTRQSLQYVVNIHAAIGFALRQTTVLATGNTRSSDVCTSLLVADIGGSLLVAMYDTGWRIRPQNPLYRMLSCTQRSILAPRHRKHSQLQQKSSKEHCAVISNPPHDGACPLKPPGDDRLRTGAEICRQLQQSALGARRWLQSLGPAR
jgi:hypothetical protein